MKSAAGFRVAAWGVAALIVIVVVGAIVYAGRKKPAPAPDTLQPADAYAASLPLSQFAMSESENLSGGKLTYLDGHVQQYGQSHRDRVTVQVVFQNDLALTPQIDTVPLTLIRMKEPYIDTEPVAAAPLKPGDDREFRLTFEIRPGQLEHPDARGADNQYSSCSNRQWRGGAGVPTRFRPCA